ncbi:hypothetical protein, partial [Duganella sp. 1411]|uniref:hypothetical protein n=1 Tax=Duganella sp. 1411 TaxID=2806572 RepID=UPI001AE64A31
TLDKSFCSSAQKKEYEAFRLFRQPLNHFFFSRFTPHLHAPFCEEANYSKAWIELTSFIFTLALSHDEYRGS